MRVEGNSALANLANKMKTSIAPDATRSAAVFGCTVEQAKRLMAKNAAALAQMADKANRNGGKCNNYTEAELRASAAQYQAASAK